MRRLAPGKFAVVTPLAQAVEAIDKRRFAAALDVKRALALFGERVTYS